MNNIIKDSSQNKTEGEFKNFSNRPAFKHPIQMLVGGANSLNKKSVVFPINELEKPTIDSVLNTVPLFYDPITKQLILQQDLEICKNLKNKNFINDKNLENLKKSSTEDKNNKEERKFLETQLDDFTTKSINLSQRPVEIKLLDQNLLLKKKLNENLDKLNDNSFKLKLVEEKNKLNDNLISATTVSSVINSSINKNLNENNSIIKTNTSTTTNKKDSFKTHRRTPSYIHDFHNVIKNNQNSSKSSSITASSAAAATAKLTKTSLANATTTLSVSTSTAKLCDQMNSISFNDSKTAKQFYFNDAKNDLNCLKNCDSNSQSSILIKSYSDEDNIEPLSLPLPYLDKPKRFSLISGPIQNVLQKLKSPVKQNNDNKETKSLVKNSKNTNSMFTTSTTALIFENRPSNLPCKNPIEEVMHRNQYEKMIKEAKKKEIKDAKIVKKNLTKKKKDEEKILNLIKTWQNEIIPDFENLRQTKKVKELWFQGIPPNLRGEVWIKAIKNNLNLDENSFDYYLKKWYDNINDVNQEKKNAEKDDKSNDHVVSCLSKCSDENVYELIKLDVSRTFPKLKLFQKGAPYHDYLLKVLGTYVIAYKPEIGYIQGMSFIVGMFLLNMDPKNAFIAFANLLNNSPLLTTFMKLDQNAMNAYYETFDIYFSLNLPELFSHFKQQKLNTDLFIMDWIYTLFTKTLPLDLSTRVWDILLRDGEETILKASLTLLKLFEKELLANDFINCAQFLTQLNSNNFAVDEVKFFNTFNNIKLSSVIIDKTKCKNFNSLYQNFITKTHN